MVASDQKIKIKSNPHCLANAEKHRLPLCNRSVWGTAGFRRSLMQAFMAPPRTRASLPLLPPAMGCICPQAPSHLVVDKWLWWPHTLLPPKFKSAQERERTTTVVMIKTKLTGASSGCSIVTVSVCKAERPEGSPGLSLRAWICGTPCLTPPATPCHSEQKVSTSHVAGQGRPPRDVRS